MTKQNNLYKLEGKINQHLAALPPERRPELSTRRRAQSVAVVTRGFEATDHNGMTESITVKMGLDWLTRNL